MATIKIPDGVGGYKVLDISGGLINSIPVATSTTLGGVKVGSNMSIANGVLTASYSAADLLTMLKTADGAGSGLDADTLDTHDTSYFATATHVQALDKGGTGATTKADAQTALGINLLQPCTMKRVLATDALIASGWANTLSLPVNSTITTDPLGCFTTNASYIDIAKAGIYRLSAHIRIAGTTVGGSYGLSFWDAANSVRYCEYTIGLGSGAMFICGTPAEQVYLPAGAHLYMATCSPSAASAIASGNTWAQIELVRLT